MAKDTRVTLTRRHAYHTRSKHIKVVKTPGAVYKAHYAGKRPGAVKCGDCGSALQGIRRMSTVEAKRAKKREKTVSRPYGGSRCAHCVKSRVVRAFLIEEQKIVKSMLMEKMKKPRK